MLTTGNKYNDFGSTLKQNPKVGKGKARVMNINGGTGSLAIICRNQKKPEKKGVNYNHKKPLLDCPIGRSFKKKIKDLSFEPFLTLPADFWIPIIFSNLNCSNILDLRNLQEQVNKAFCFKN